MGRTVHTPKTLPITPERQDELAKGWEDLTAERAPFREVPEGEESLEDRCKEILSELPANPTKKE